MKTALKQISRMLGFLCLCLGIFTACANGPSKKSSGESKHQSKVFNLPSMEVENQGEESPPRKDVADTPIKAKMEVVWENNLEFDITPTWLDPSKPLAWDKGSGTVTLTINPKGSKDFKETKVIYDIVTRQKSDEANPVDVICDPVWLPKSKLLFVVLVVNPEIVFTLQKVNLLIDDGAHLNITFLSGSGRSSPEKIKGVIEYNAKTERLTGFRPPHKHGKTTRVIYTGNDVQHKLLSTFVVTARETVYFIVDGPRTNYDQPLVVDQ